MQEILGSQSAGALILSAVFVWYFVRYQYHRLDQPQNTALSMFGWAMLCMSLYTFGNSVLFFLWDFDLISKTTQYKLSVAPRMFGIAGLVMSLFALQVPNRKMFIAAAVVVSVVLILRITGLPAWFIL